MSLNPKIIALYLPQYHEIPENNLWWGEGFTEWTNVKRAKSLYSGHSQPVVPLNDNYYCTLDISTRKWQAEIAKKHGIYGFCYYHYWFGENDLLLEKPLQLLCDEAEPNIPFCLSWANGSWARTWEGQPKEILKKQTYGDEASWEKHFNYLLKFFKHPLYIMENNKPLFLIHNPEDIGKDRLDAMILVWNNLAVESGFDGIEIIETLVYSQTTPICTGSSGVFHLEPLGTLRNELSLKIAVNIFKHVINIISEKIFLRGFFLNVIDFQEVWRLIHRKQDRCNNYYHGKKFYYGSFVGWDNTPRKQTAGLIMQNNSPQIFKENFQKQVQRAKDKSIGYIFINAWNEWAEGAYLEPDKTHGFGYLEAIKSIITK